MFILELSKVLMCEFHYDYIENKYDNKSKLLFTDTDSLMYEIKTEDVYEDFSSNKKMFDFSNYSSKSKYYDNSNKLVIGKVLGQLLPRKIPPNLKLNPNPNPNPNRGPIFLGGNYSDTDWKNEK